MSKWLESRATFLAALLIAGWPVMRWYVARMGDGSDEPWGIVALVAALLFLPREGWRDTVTARRQLTLCVLATLYFCALFFGLPALVRALIFVSAIATLVARRGFATAWWALLVLSLPLVATLQFYLGYPLRLATTELSAGLLTLGGLTVRASGTTLLWAGERVVVDAPCSGIHMLWTGLLIAALLACWQRLDWRNTLRLLHRASLIVFVANILRATMLFCLETGLWPTAPWAHESVGLALFAAAAITIFCLSEKRIRTA